MYQGPVVLKYFRHKTVFHVTILYPVPSDVKCKIGVIFMKLIDIVFYTFSLKILGRSCLFFPFLIILFCWIPQFYYFSRPVLFFFSFILTVRIYFARANSLFEFYISLSSINANHAAIVYFWCVFKRKLQKGDTRAGRASSRSGSFSKHYCDKK